MFHYFIIIFKRSIISSTWRKNEFAQIFSLQICRKYVKTEE